MNKKVLNKKIIHLAAFVSSLSLVSIAVSSGLVLKTQNNHQSFLSYSVVDNRSENEDVLISDINSPTITTKSGFIISSFFDRVQIKNFNNENIYTIDTTLIKSVLNSRADLKILKTKEQNDKLIIIAGEKDSNNQQLSSFLIVFNLENKNISFAQKINGFTNQVDLIYFLNDNKLLLTNGRNSISNIKNKIDATILDLENFTFENKPFSESNLLSEIDSSKYNPDYSYLVDINQNEFSNKNYLYVLGSKDQKSYELLMYEAEDLLNLKMINQEPIVISKNNLGFPGVAYLNGVKFYNTELMNFNFSYMSSEKLIASFTSSMRHQIAFSTVDLANNSLINSFNFATDKFVKKISSARNYDSFGYLGSSDRLSQYLIEDFQRTDRLGHLKPIVKDSSTLYVPIIPYNRLGYYPRTGGRTSSSDDVYFKGRFVIFKFNDSLNEITKVDAFRNQKDQLASWISKDPNNIKNNTSLNEKEYLYGFINKINDKIFASNGKSDLIYIMNETQNDNSINVEYSKNIASQNIVDDLNIPTDINLNVLASQYLNDNQEQIKDWFKQKDLVNNINISSSDLLGELYINYKINTSTWYSSEPTSIKRTKVISGFKKLIDLRPIFKFNDDPSLYDVSNQNAFKAKAIADITKEDIINYNIISIPNHEINKDYIRLENNYNIELKVYYEDPQLDSYKSFFKTFNNYNGFSKINQEEASNITYNWDFNNDLLNKEKKYLPSEFDQELANQLFSLANANNNFEVSTKPNDEEKTLELTAKVYLNPLFFTTIKTKIEGFGDKNKPPKDLIVTTINLINNDILKDAETKKYTLDFSFENIIEPKFVSFDIVDPTNNLILKSFVKQNVNNQTLSVDISEFEDDKEYIANNFKFYENENDSIETNKVEIKEQTLKEFNFRTILPAVLQKQVGSFSVNEIQNKFDYEQKTAKLKLLNVDLNSSQTFNLILEYKDEQNNKIEKTVDATKQEDGSLLFNLDLPSYNKTYFLNGITFQNQSIKINESISQEPLILKKDELNISKISYDNISKNSAEIIVNLSDINFKNDLTKKITLVLRDNNNLKEIDVTDSLDLNTKIIKYKIKDLQAQTNYEVVDLKINDKKVAIEKLKENNETNFETNNSEPIQDQNDQNDNNSNEINKQNSSDAKVESNKKPNQKSNSVMYGVIGGIASIVGVAVALIAGFAIKKKIKK